MIDANTAEEWHFDNLREAEEAYENLCKENRFLRQAVKEYGHHKNSCKGFPASSEEQLARNCTCGFQKFKVS